MLCKLHSLAACPVCQPNTSDISMEFSPSLETLSFHLGSQEPAAPKTTQRRIVSVRNKKSNSAIVNPIKSHPLESLPYIERFHTLFDTMPSDMGQFVQTILQTYLEPFARNNTILNTLYVTKIKNAVDIRKALLDVYQTEMNVYQESIQHHWLDDSQRLNIENFFRAIEVIIAKFEQVELVASPQPDQLSNGIDHSQRRLPASAPLKGQWDGQYWKPFWKTSTSADKGQSEYFSAYPFVAPVIPLPQTTAYLPPSIPSGEIKPTELPPRSLQILRERARISKQKDGRILLLLDLDQTLVDNSRDYKIYHALLAEVIRQMAMMMSLELAIMDKFSIINQELEALISACNPLHMRIYEAREKYTKLMEGLKAKLNTSDFESRIQPLHDLFLRWDENKMFPEEQTQFFNLMLIDEAFLASKLATAPNNIQAFEINDEWNRFFEYVYSQKAPDGAALFYIALCSKNILPTVILKAMRQGNWGLHPKYIDRLEADMDLHSVFYTEEPNKLEHAKISVTALQARGEKVLTTTLIDDDRENCLAMLLAGDSKGDAYWFRPSYRDEVSHHDRIEPAKSIFEVLALVKELTGNAPCALSWDRV